MTTKLIILSVIVLFVYSIALFLSGYVLGAGKKRRQIGGDKINSLKELLRGEDPKRMEAIIALDTAEHEEKSGELRVQWTSLILASLFSAIGLLLTAMNLLK
jgi:hypothetical protein